MLFNTYEAEFVWGKIVDFVFSDIFFVIVTTGYWHLASTLMSMLQWFYSWPDTRSSALSYTEKCAEVAVASLRTAHDEWVIEVLPESDWTLCQKYDDFLAKGRVTTWIIGRLMLITYTLLCSRVRRRPRQAPHACTKPPAAAAFFGWPLRPRSFPLWSDRWSPCQ